MPNSLGALFTDKLSMAVLLIRSTWHWFLTSLIVVIAVIVFLKSPDLHHAAEFGEFLAGFSSALAFLWLIIGLRFQAADLALQRQALEKQAKELKNSAKFASLAQIEAIVDRTQMRIRENELGIKDASEITNLWLASMQHWKEMLESKDADAVQTRYVNWLKVEGLARGYLSGIATALKLYMEHYIEMPFDQKLSDEDFVFIYSAWMNRAPFLAEHAGIALMVADFVMKFVPGLEAIKVAGLFSMAKLFGKDMFKEGALDQLRNELIQKNIAVPAIAMD